MASNVSGTQAVDRAALLVSLVVRADHPLSFTELSETADLARSTTSRLLAALERSQLVERDVDGNYLPGSLFALYATRTDPQAELIRHAHPALERVRDVTGETANLGMAQGNTVMHVDQADSRYLLGTQDWTQIVVPAHASALGRVLQAFDALPLPTESMERLTSSTITEPRQLARELAQVRRRGYAVTVDELEVGLTGLAAPIIGPQGEVAALGVSGPTARLKSRVSEVGRLLVEQADTVSTLLRRRATNGRSSMTPEEILTGLYEQTLLGNGPEVLSLTHQGLELGMEPQSMLFDALIPSLEEVGARFERGDYFVPEMLIAGKAMAGAMEVLRPLLAETGVETVGKFLMGTVKGDVHDIGKNLVNIMLEGAGFEVIDLGVQVAPEKFIAAVEEHKPDIVGFSAFLTTTMPMFKANINAFQKAGIRDQVVIMVGGAPVTQEYADAVGADGYAADASATVKKAKDLLQKKRALVNA